ncbi:MAG: protein-L-isoaspartate(D-aspartate) O-methyltransferase [Nitrospina sp.]|jgi:protein-L-isoaspartate(D-aspartate) O-methyltransferase|nr:protein-L-isoaspartate(D-aspartate) O-methyltransferase [Nitrospina sp.]MBT5257460.1 protein-L-isoaspartate(D-aspartate) O-methyltransferase [Nitrospina sp.]MBT6296087.1 protein-L-isoaspartate(D-aspartate) O-methyltransferase [Nitrospina sp.]MBT7272305.1 protein-L-isoaspartate(D-aspartate) O-methyltransferase [Nitrospina sp.]
MVEKQILGRGIKDLSVMEVLSRVPRHLFVNSSLQHRAYGDCPLPIGENQTISQPYIVALMTQVLDLKGGERVLEIGTGSGYQTAILAELASHVFTIERVKPLVKKTKELLEGLKYKNIVFKTFDGTYGWRDQSPFDAILISAATPSIPKSLIEQLADKGRLVAPVGERESQDLIVLNKNGNKVMERKIGSCKFVPLIGKFAWSEEE